MKRQLISKSNIVYEEVGQGYPLLMMHSFLWDHMVWQPQMNVLSNHYRCIAPDFWSHGGSDLLPNVNHTIEDLTQDYWQFSQALSLDKFALIGLSFGGMLAIRMALMHPEAISALVLINTYPGPESHDTQKTYFWMMDALIRDKKFTPSLAEEVAPFFFGKNTHIEQPQLVENFVQSLIDIPQDNIPSLIALGRSIFNRKSILEQLPKLNIPTLIIVGEEDFARPPKLTKEVAKLIPNSQLEIIPHAGNICTLEKPDKINEIIKQFLANHL